MADQDFEIVYGSPKGSSKKTNPPAKADLDFELVEASAPIKKKNPGTINTALPLTSANSKSSLVSPLAKPNTQQPQDMSVTPGQSQGKLLMAEKKPQTVADVLSDNKKRFDVTSPSFASKQQQAPQPPASAKVGAMEDIGNTFMSSASRLVSGLAGIPNMAQKAALMMTTKMLGVDDEYNALPVQAKKEINNVMSSIAQSGGIPSPNVSRQAQNYFIKKSDEFLANTNKSDKFFNERVGDFFKTPSVEGAADLFLEIPKTFAGSLPYMINPLVGAVSSASDQYNKDIEEAGGKLGWGQLVNAGVTGVTEYYIEKLSQGILNRSISEAIGVPKAAAKLAQGWVKSVLKDVGLEGAGEGLTEFVQSLSDDITKGKEINWVETANRTIDAALLGFGLAGGMRATGAGVGYLAKKVMPKSDVTKIDRNTRAIMDLNSKKGPDNSPAVNSVIDGKIKQLNDENKNIINTSIDKVKSLSDDQLKEVVKIDSEISAIKSNRDAIVADQNLNDEEKQSLLDYLKSQAATLTERKTAVQNQQPLTEASFGQPDEFGRITFEFGSEKEIPSELKGLTPTGTGSSTDEKGNRKIFLSFSEEQLKPIRDAIQKQTTSEVPFQPGAGTGLQVAEGEPQAEPQVTAQEGQRQEIERRRKEELDPYSSQMIESEEIFDGLDSGDEPVVYVVRTMVDGSRQIRIQLTTDGKVETFPLGKAGKDISFSNSELLEKSYGLQNGKSISTNNNPTKPKKINAINAKYDAELAALEPQVPTQEGQGQEVAPATQPTAEQPTAKQPTTPEQPVEEPKQIKVADAETIAKEMQTIFGLNKTQSKAAAVVIDKIANTMAKRAGTTKSKIMDAIVFRKGDVNELSDKALFQKAKPINAPKEDIQKAVNEITSMGKRSPFGGNNIFMPNGIVVEVSNFDGALFIDSIFTPENLRGKGFATSAMVDILDIASKYNVPVSLTAQPFGAQKGLAKNQLINWYKKLGFKDIGYGELQKAPTPISKEVIKEGQEINVEPVAKVEAKEKRKMPEGAKLVKPENFFLDGEYDVVVNGKTIGNIYYDRASKTWNDPNYDRSQETPWSFKWIYGEILGENKEEAVAELIKRHEQFPEGVKPKGDVLFQKAYHGGASKFNKFSTGKIGTGNKSRFGGWGLYFTLDKARANTYANQLKNDDIEIGDFKIPKSDYRYDELKEIFEKTNSVIGVTKELLKLSESSREAAIKSLNNIFDGKYKEYESAYEKASLNVLDGVDVENSKKIIKDFQDRYEYAENGLYGTYNNRAYEYRKLARTALSEGAKLNNQPAYTYEVSIADDLNLLDFNETISEENYEKILSQAIKENSKFVPGILKNKKSSGKDFYFNVSQDPDYYDNDEELSLLMLRSGIDGNIMRSQGTQDVILFDENAVEISNVIQFQQGKQGGIAKGAMQLASDGSAIIYALTDPDVSTPLHEMAHVYENYLTEDEIKTVLDWAGKKDWDMPVSEKFARGFEKYLAEGKSPNKELTKIFESFKNWLLNIYKGIVDSEIDIKLNDGMRKIYDTMLTEGEEVGIKELPGYARMMGEVDGIVKKSFNRGVPYMQTMDNAIKYMEKSKVYENATDTQREAMVREVRKMFKQKEIKAKSAQEYVGKKPTKTTITIDESKELNKRLKALEAAEQTGRKIGYKEGLKESEQARKDIIDYVKSLKVNNKISGAQFKSIVNSLKANLLNPVIRKRVEERIDKIIKKANYADQLERSNKLRTAIKKAYKSKTLAANIAVMAKKFANVNPNNIENLDEYIDMANLVYNSVGNPMRTIAEEAMVNEYSEMKIKEAQEAKSAGLEELFDSLVKQGLIPKNLSLAEIQQYILNEEQNKKVEESEQRKKEKRDVLGIVFDSLKDISNIMLNDGYNPFTGEEVTLSSEDRQLLKDFTLMDISKIPIASAYRAQEALMNYIVNGKKFGMEAILAEYQGGVENIKIAVDKNLKAGDFRWGVGPSWWGSRKWAKEVESIPGLFIWMWRGKARGAEVMKLMGVEDILSGAAEAKLKRIKNESEYIDKFLKTKPNGKRFNSVSNTYERLIYGYLSRSVDGTTEEKQEEFTRRQRILSQVVQALKESRNKDLIKEGDILNEEFSKVKNAKNIDDIQDKFDKTNKEAVKFISNMFDKDYDFVEGVAEGVYNLMLNKDEFYTPDMFRSIADEPVNVEDATKTVDFSFDSINKKPAGTMMKNSRIENLPGYDVANKDASDVTKILKLDFDSSAFNAYEKSLVDAYTAKAVKKYSAFVKSKGFSKLFDNAKDETLFKEILNYYINNERGKIGYKSDLKEVQNFSNRLKSLSTYAALGSVSAIVKQSISAIVNTSINLSNDPNALKEARKVLFPNILSKSSTDNAIAAQEFINEYGGQINLRGAETTADIKSAEKLVKESKYQTLTDVLDVLDKAGRIKMKPLSKGDVPPARASWIGYYVHSLKLQDKPHKNINWKTEKPNKEAIAYANNEVSISQNASMPSILGKAFSTKKPATRILMAYMLPFSSFLFNAKSRLKTDFTVMTSKLATPEDKQAAGRSMVATLAELPGYIAIQTSISYLISSMAQSIIGYDEDEEEEKLRRKRYSELAITRIVTDLISPFPNIGDAATIALFNAIIEKTQSETDFDPDEPKVEPFKLFENKPQSMIGAMAETLVQPVASTGRRVADIYKTFDMLVGDVYESGGKEIEFSSEDKKILAIAAVMQGMSGLNLLPSETESLANKMVKTIEKQAKRDATM